MDQVSGNSSEEQRAEHSSLARSSPDDDQHTESPGSEPRSRVSGQRSTDIQRQESGASSELTGEFMQRDPAFSTKFSVTSSDSDFTDLAPAPVVVTVLWRKLSVVRLLSEPKKPGRSLSLKS